jgi:hypothetical protein
MAKHLLYQHLEKPKETEKELEMAITWLKAEMSTKQLAKHLNCSQVFVYQWITPRLRLAYQLKKLSAK